MQSLERSSQQENNLPQIGITALFLFDYDCPESSDAVPVFESVRACLESSQGLCAFNDAGILSPKALAALANHARLKKEVAGGVVDTERYRSITPSVAAMWTDRTENVDVFHDYLSAHSVRGYQGAFLLEPSVGYDDFLSFCAGSLNAGSSIRRSRNGGVIGAWVEGLRCMRERWKVTHLGGIRKRLKQNPMLAGVSALVGVILAVGTFVATRKPADLRGGDVPSAVEVRTKEQIPLEVLPLSSFASPAKPSGEVEVELPKSSGPSRPGDEPQLKGIAEQAKSDIGNVREQAPVGRTSSYTVQIGSFRNKKSATRIEESLRAGGYPVFVKSAQIPAKGVIHRVRVGRFDSREEAQRFGKELRGKEPLIASFLVMANE